jgi:hypothetical protein
LDTNNFSNDQREIQLGISFLTFQNHHLVVHLTRNDKTAGEECLASARAAINLLESLVSNSTAVYNGISWQLLYYPFTPFFVLFGKIVSDPHSKDTFDDLQLLRKTVMFYLRMHNNHKSASKLENTAETFTRHAEGYVRYSMRKKSVQVSAQDDAASNSSSNSKSPMLIKANSSIPSWNINQPQQQSSLSSQSDEQHHQVSPLAFLNSYSPLESSPSMTDLTNDSASYASSIPGEPVGPDTSDAAIFQSIENMVGEWITPLDCNFDWFSWEQYEKSGGMDVNMCLD